LDTSGGARYGRRCGVRQSGCRQQDADGDGGIITGPLLVWLKYGGTSGFNVWFWVKMVLVVILLGIVIFAGINGKRAQGGDMEAAKRSPQIGMASIVTFLLVVAAAVLAFD
jgi:uncharacterized membrane protein